MTRRRDLPQPSSPNFAQRMRETVQTYLGRQGSPLDRGITLRDLLESGVVALRPGHTLTPGTDTLPITPGAPTGSEAEPDLTPPPVPSGFSVTAAISHVFIAHDDPIYPQGRGHLRTRVFGAVVTPELPEPVFTDAVEIAQFTGAVGAVSSNPGTTWRLWITWESRDGVQSVAPAGGTNGLQARTGEDVSSLIEAMTGPGNPFVILPEDTEIDGVLFPAGTYSARAFIQDAQITSAKIKALAVDDAHIARVSAAKITAGSVSVGEYMQSTGYVASEAGWRINGNGAAEFSGVVVRGTIYAAAGQIGGSTIGSTYIRSTTYSLGDSGWNFNSDGTGQIGGFAILADAVQSFNFVAGSAGWRLRRDGTFEANTGTFRGNLSGNNISGAQFTTGGYTGWAWPPAGQGGCYLGPSGLLMGNYNTGRFVQITAAGDFTAPGMSIHNGVLTISQANVISSLQLANQAVSVSASAAGWNGCSTAIYVPSGVTATIFAIATKSSNTTSQVYWPTTLTLNLGGSIFTSQAHGTYAPDPNSEGSAGVWAIPGITVTGQIVINGPVTVSAGASIDLNNGGANTSLILMARWK